MSKLTATLLIALFAFSVIVDASFLHSRTRNRLTARITSETGDNYSCNIGYGQCATSANCAAAGDTNQCVQFKDAQHQYCCKRTGVNPNAHAHLFYTPDANRKLVLQGMPQQYQNAAPTVL